MKYLLYMMFLFHSTYATKWFGTPLQSNGVKVWQIDHVKLSVTEPDFYFTRYIQSQCRFSKISYIVHKAVEVKGILTHTIYYLFGKFIIDPKTLSKKEKIIDLVIELWDELQQYSTNVSIVKETCERESKEFLSIFPEDSNIGKSKKRLYRVTMDMEKTIIVQVPPKFSELTLKDMFVLDSHHGVYMFSATDIQEGSKFAVSKELIGFILKYDYEERKKYFLIPTESKKKIIYLNRFVSLFGIPPDKRQIISNKELDRVQNQHELYEISEEQPDTPTYIPPYEISDVENGEVTQMKLHSVSVINPYKCYFLFKKNIKEVFVHIGKYVEVNLRKKCLLYAEEQEQEEFLVSTVYGDRVAAFAIIFHEIYTEDTVNFDLIESALFPN